MSAAHLQQRSSQSHSPTQRAFMMTLSRSFLLTERVRARSSTSASDDATALSDQRRCMASCRCLYAIPPPSLSPPPLSNARGENAFTFNLNTTESARRASVLFWHFISTIYSTLSGWRMHIAWLGSMPGKLNRHKSCTPVSRDKTRWYQCTW